MDEYETFQDIGRGATPGPEYKRINVHFVFAVKHDLCHKARLVAGGHLTEPSRESNYSGVVSLQSIRTVMLVAEANALKTMVGDVGNAYLEAYTQEKVYFIAGPEFGPLQGHTMIIIKALYGLRSSGLRYHKRFADTLRNMGFIQCKSDTNVWLKDCGTHYEYVCVYVDDLMIMSKNPRKFFDLLINIHGYKLKGVSEPSYHLGGDFYRDKDGTLAWGAASYITKILENYKQTFGEKPKQKGSPMELGDHPEMDQTEELDEDGVKLYQSLIGALQWLITLGRFDIQQAVTSLSSFCTMPQKGHLERVKRVFGYLKRTKTGAIRFCTGIPDHEVRTEENGGDWSYLVYGDVQEEIPEDAPRPLGAKI